MTDFYGDPDAALARVAEQIAQAQERAARASEVRAAIDRVRGRARSRRGEVTVEVDVTGRMTDLRLDDEAMSLDAADLAGLIRETVTLATRDAGVRAVAVSDDAFGEGSSISAHLRGELQTRGEV